MIYKTIIEIGRTFNTNGELINTINFLEKLKREGAKIKYSVRLFDPKKNKVLKSKISKAKLINTPPEKLYLAVKFYLDSSTRLHTRVHKTLLPPEVRLGSALNEQEFPNTPGSLKNKNNINNNNAPPALEPSSLPRNIENSWDALVVNGKLVYRRRKKSRLRKELDILKSKNKNTVSNLMKRRKNRPKPDITTSLDKVTERTLAEIMKLHWFVTHRKSSQSYEKSFLLVKKNFRRYRSSLIDIFKLANDYFSNPRFIYKTNKKINVFEFFRYHPATINRSKALQRIGVNSWFKEFAKGKEHIEEHFVKRQKDSHPELTKQVEKIWIDFKKSPDIKPHEHDNLVRFVDKCFAFRDVNESRIKSARDLISILKDIILADQNTHVKNTNYLLTNYFWRNTIPDALKKWGMFEHHERINLI